MGNLDDIELREYMGVSFPLADALQMELLLEKKNEQGKNRYVLHGTQIFSASAGEAEVELEVKVLASTVRKGYAGVLVKIRRRLWVYAAYNNALSELTLMVLDASLAGFKESQPKTYSFVNGLVGKEVSELLGPSAVAIFSRGVREAVWKRTDDLPVANKNSEVAVNADGGLDKGQAPVTGEDHRGDDSAGESKT